MDTHSFLDGLTVQDDVGQLHLRELVLSNPACNPNISALRVQQPGDDPGVAKPSGSCGSNPDAYLVLSAAFQTNQRFRVATSSGKQPVFLVKVSCLIMSQAATISDLTP
jgi:hypothetical protein